MSNNIFKAPASTSQQMADSLPNGRAWASKNIDSANVKKLINALSVAHNRAQQQIELLDDEFRIDQTFDLLEDWEESVGIPDQCISESETIEQRRQAVIDRLRKQPLVSLQQIEDYINEIFTGTGITLQTGVSVYEYEYTFPVSFFNGNYSKFVIVVNIPTGGESFEYTFEVPFTGSPDTEKIECLLNKILPSNVILIIRFTG